MGPLNKGIKFFKQDDPYPRMIQSTEWLPPEPNSGLRGSGDLSAGEMTNVTNSLYSQTAMEEYTRVTGERAMIMYNGYGSSIASQRWPFTWEADFALGGGALNASLSGHSLVSTRDRNEVPDGIHAGYLAPFCYLESWAYYKEPWLYSQDLLDMNRFYIKLRYRLVPYLYSSLHESAESALPVMRPMVLEYQNDPVAQQNQSQYLLGDWLLVAPARSTMESGSESSHMGVGQQLADTHTKVYLPKGQWYDFWTGRRGQQRRVANGGMAFLCGRTAVGEGRSHHPHGAGHFLHRSGAPGGGSSGHLPSGRVADTRCMKTMAARMTTRRARSPRPTSTSMNVGTRLTSTLARGVGRTLHASASCLPDQLAYGVSASECVSKRAGPRRIGLLAALVRSAGAHGWCYDEPKQIAWVKATAGWRFGADARGAQNDPEQDTAYWDNAATGRTPVIGFAWRFQKSSSPRNRGHWRREQPITPWCAP